MSERRLCECGCGQPSPIATKTCLKYGHVKGQPIRFIRDHYNRTRRIPLADKFWPRVQKAAGDACWEWTGPLDRWGYGTTRLPGSRTPMHASRAAWLLAHGPIPDGLQVCHKCDNPPCVRVDHLFLGTAWENHQDCLKKGRGNAATGEQTGAAKLTTEQARTIFLRVQRGELRYRVAKEFGLAAATVGRIANRCAWKSVTADLVK